MYGRDPIPRVGVRLVHAEAGQVGRSVAGRAALLTQTRSVLIVSARLPSPALRRELEAAGADLARVFIIDVTSHGLHTTARDPDHEAHVPGPALLELIAKRSEQVLRAKAERPATVLIDDVGTFAHYNPVEALVEIVHQMVARRQPQNHHEYILGGAEPARLVESLRHVVQEECDILPSGDLTPHPPAPGRASSKVDLSKNVQPKR